MRRPRVNLYALRKKPKTLKLNIQIHPGRLMTRKGTPIWAPLVKSCIYNSHEQITSPRIRRIRNLGFSHTSHVLG